MEKIIFVMSNATIAFGIILLLVLSCSIVYKLIINQYVLHYILMRDEYKLRYTQECYDVIHSKIQNLGSIQYGNVSSYGAEYGSKVTMNKEKICYCFNYSTKNDRQIKENKFLEKERQLLIVA